LWCEPPKCLEEGQKRGEGLDIHRTSGIAVAPQCGRGITVKPGRDGKRE